MDKTDLNIKCLSMKRNLPTMLDVARVASVSSMTVSRVYKRHSSVSPETREAVWRAAEAIGYVFDVNASNLRSKKTDFVAITIPSINNANFSDTVSALTDGLSGRGLQIIIGSTNYDIDQEERLIEQLLSRRPEAIVVTGGTHTPRARKILKNAQIPVIEIWDLPAEPIGHVVGFSNAEAVHLMVNYFVSVGYRKIAFIGGDVERDIRGSERRAGFVAALSNHGIDASRLIAAGPSPISMREGVTAIGHLLETFPDTDAVICVSDLLAFGALTECQRRGIRVPEALAIGGFGDYEIAEISVPSMTTINVFARDIGRQAANLICDLLSQKNPEPRPRKVMINPELIVRNSSR